MPIIKKSQTIRKTRKGVSSSYYQLPDVNKGTTIARAIFTGEHGEATIGKRERVYCILKGNAEFQINGKKMNACEEDIVVIPPHGTYNLWPVDGPVEVLLIMEHFDFE